MKKINIQTFALFAGLIFAGIQLAANTKNQQSNFIANSYGLFYSNPLFYDTYHDLVYSYSDEIFEKIDEKAKEWGWKEDTERIIRGEEPLFKRPLFIRSIKDGVDRTAVNNNRLYHPWVFQQSPEEKRLDMLLGFLNMVAWHYETGQIRLKDIYGHFGPQIVTIAKRKVIESYFDVQELAWEQTRFQERCGNVAPIKRVKKLFNCMLFYDRYILKFKIL